MGWELLGCPVCYMMQDSLPSPRLAQSVSAFQSASATVFHLAVEDYFVSATDGCLS